MKILLIIIFFIILLFFVLAIIIPFISTDVLIAFVFKKSTEKKTPEFLTNERQEMEQKVTSMLGDLKDWHLLTVNDFSNNMKFSFFKGIRSQLTGTILSNDEEGMIAFQRIDRGLYTNARIVAKTTVFNLYMEKDTVETRIYFDNAYWGKIDKHFNLYNAANEPIGATGRMYNEVEYSYVVLMNDRTIANISKGLNRKPIETNPGYRLNRRTSLRNSPLRMVEPQPVYKLVDSAVTLTKEEEQWIIALAVLEVVYYGFNFVR